MIAADRFTLVSVPGRDDADEGTLHVMDTVSRRSERVADLAAARALLRDLRAGVRQLAAHPRRR